MKQVVGINFKTPGKMYYFDPGNLKLKKGTHVIVDTAMGEEYGEVTMTNKEIEDNKVSEPLKKVIRVATYKESKMCEEYKAKEQEAFHRCQNIPLQPYSAIWNGRPVWSVQLEHRLKHHQALML